MVKPSDAGECQSPTRSSRCQGERQEDQQEYPSETSSEFIQGNHESSWLGPVSPLPKSRVEKFDNMHCKNPALDATTTHCSLFTNTSRHDKFAAATILQSGLATAEAHITAEKLFPLPPADLQDEAERIRESNAEEDVIDLPEQERKCTQGLVFVLTIFIH